MFFAAYAGPSMNPTLREPEIMEIVPYDGRPLRVGDVVFFQPPHAEQPVVHRIVRITAEGIATLGDNNAREDAYLLRPERIRGRVVAAWRGQKRRPIAGGLPGRSASRWLRWRRFVDRGLSPLLHPLYHFLSQRGFIARVLPSRLRPRVVVFHTQGREQFQLLLGKRLIGRYDDRRHRWQIQRPFHLFVDKGALPGRQNRDALQRHVFSRRQRTLDPPPAQEMPLRLSLADGTCWEIAAADQGAAAMVSQLGEAMRLRATPGASAPSPHAARCRLLVHVDAHAGVTDGFVPLASKNNGLAVVCLDPSDRWGGPYFNLVRLSLVFAREAQARGGFLIHGALAERDGQGVILAAPGGTGKTTASNRLPPPWRSLCDDTALVVRDARGAYRAHPWPTWSRFQDGGPGGAWDVQAAIPLHGIFVLARSGENRVERVGPGHAVSLLVECVGQASASMAPGLGKEELQALNLERFDNLCALARTMPVHMLHISLNGAFWQEIDRALAGPLCEGGQDPTGRNKAD